MNSRKFLLGLAVLCLSATVFAQGPKPAESATTVAPAPAGKSALKFDPKRDPSKDLKTAIAEATRTHRRILLDVGGEWCVWCKYFDQFFESNATLRQFRDENFVVVRVNFSKENENAAFLGQYPKVPGYPHLFVLDSDGKFLHSQPTSPLEQGRSYSTQEVSKFLSTWAKKK